MDLWKVPFILLVGQALSVIEGRPSVNGTESSDAAYLEADEFLTSYGYYALNGLLPAQMPHPSLRKHSDTERTKALKLFQEFYDLPQSGKLDKETTQLMQRPRCGNADIPSNVNTVGTRADVQLEEGEDVSQTRKDNETSGIEESGVHVNRGRRSLASPRLTRVKRWHVLKDKDGAMYKWPKDEMRWAIYNYSKKLTENFQRRVIEKAVSIWAPEVPFKFVEETDWTMAHMMFIFHSFPKSGLDDTGHFQTDWLKERPRRFNRPHWGPKMPKLHRLDPGIAHAMIPFTVNSTRFSLARDLHFNEDHDWSEKELLSVALHGIGHAVGLDHAKHPYSIMNPYFDHKFLLFPPADVLSIQEIYGSNFGVRGKLICDTKISGLTDVFKAPLHPNAQSYYFVSGTRVQLMSEKEQLRTYYPFEDVFPNVTSKYDVAFASGNNTVIFIAGQTRFILPYYGNKRFGPTNEEGYIGLTPFFAVNIDTPAKRRTRLFTYQNVWDVRMEGPREFFLGNTFRASSSDLTNLIKNAKFAVQWTDGLVYVGTRDGRYATMNVSLDGSGSEEISEMKEGHPPWMRRWLCGDKTVPCTGPTCPLSPGHSNEACGVPGPGLMLVVMLSLIKLY